MQDLITSFILQSKECKLPGIGKFRQVITPAETDMGKNQIVPPITVFHFRGREDKISNELINYIAVKRNITIAEAQVLIKEWCSDISSRLENGEDILLPSFGSLRKGTYGDITLQRQNDILFFVPVIAERIVHKSGVHNVLVGDRETNSSVMNELLNQDKAARTPSWKIISLILLIVAVLLLFFYFYQHPLSLSSTGNQQQVVPGAPPATYYTK